MKVSVVDRLPTGTTRRTLLPRMSGMPRPLVAVAAIALMVTPLAERRAEA